MTDRERMLVRESFEDAAGMAGPVSLAFYGRLFELDPALRPMFHGDIARQGRKLMEMLSAVVEHIDRMDALLPALHAMGQRHAAYGVRPSHYETVETALLWALGQALGTDFDSETRSAWRAVIETVGSAMKEGAAQLPATGTE